MICFSCMEYCVIVFLRFFGGFVALDWLPSGAANKKTPAELKESLAGVRFVAAIGCKTGWERTMPRLDGVVAVIDANVHGFCLAFVVVEICGSM